MKETIYRNRPSPEVDAAWSALGANCKSEIPRYRVNEVSDKRKVEGFIVAEDDGARYGLHEGMVKRVPEQGGGFIVHSEGMHHLHCLNLLRQSSYFNYEYYHSLRQGAFVNEEKILEKHISTLTFDRLRERHAYKLAHRPLCRHPSSTVDVQI